MSRTKPPQWGERVLRLLHDPDDAEFILGDLEEDFSRYADRDGVDSARSWYRRQVWGCVRSRLATVASPSGGPGELRHAIRRLRRDPGYTGVTVATLGVGLAGAVTIGALAVSVLRPLPYPSPSELVAVWETRAGTPRSVSPGNYLDWRRLNERFAGLAAHDVRSVSVTVGERASRASIAVVSGNFFSVLGVAPARGPGFSSDLDTQYPGRHLVLSDQGANRLFGSADQAIGADLLIDDLTYEVVGTMPATFDFPEPELLGWIRSRTEAPELRGLPPGFTLTEMRDIWYFQVVGRLATGTSVDVGRDDLASVASALSATYPDTNDRAGVQIIPLHDQTVADFDRILLALAMAVGLVLLAALFNATHLTRARAQALRKDTAIRVSLGATRGSLARAQLIEGWIVGLLATVLAVGLATLALDVTRGSLSSAIPRANQLTLDPWLILAALALGLVTGTILSRASLQVVAPKGDLRSRLSRSSGERVLVSVQVAVSIAVLAGATLLAQSIYELGRVDLGFDTARLSTMSLSIPDAPSLSYEERLQRYRDVRAAVHALPEVETASLGSNLPLTMGMGAGVRVEGVVRDQDPPNSGWQPVEASYFQALGMTLESGRLFTAQDEAGAPDVAIVNETFAREILLDREPIGTEVTMGLDGHDRPLTIVGVVRDTRSQGPAQRPGPVLYRPLDQTGRYPAGTMSLVARTSAGGSLAQIAATVRSVAPGLAVSQERTGEALIRPFRAGQTMLLTIMAVFAATAVTLALVGVYGVGMHAVQRGRRDIGVRLALGATRERMTRDVIGGGMRSALLGVPPGLVLAYLVGQSIRDLLFAISPGEPLALLAVTVGVVFLTAGAFWIPARRAARLDPALTMRDG